jgi:hypothetical protein
MRGAVVSLFAAFALLASAGSAAAALVVSVGRNAVARVQPGFLGLSFEVRGIEAFTGFAPQAINPVFEQLVRNLDPGQRPVLRIGGDTGDWSWYPIPHMQRPLGVRYALTPTWFKVVSSLAEATDARLIVGLNLEVDSARVAAAEARAMISQIGSRWLEALQLGNEPELYNLLAWYEQHGVRYYGRGSGWGVPQYLSDFAAIARALPNFPLAGPEVGRPPWDDEFGQFLSQEPRVRIATLHRYSLPCVPVSAASVSGLLAVGAAGGFTNGLIPALRAAHAHGIPIRIDEMGPFPCNSEHGSGHTFAAALWELEAAFEAAKAGFDGINIHTRDGVSTEPFTFTRTGGVWRGHVSPDYYGLLAFAQAVPRGSQLLSVSGAGGAVRAWATRAPDGVTRVVLINFARRVGQVVAVKAPGAGGAAALVRLTAPNAAATGGVTLGGQSFGASTTTGRLAGQLKATQVPLAHVWLPAASAAILTLR